MHVDRQRLLILQLQVNSINVPNNIQLKLLDIWLPKTYNIHAFMGFV